MKPGDTKIHPVWGEVKLIKPAAKGEWIVKCPDGHDRTITESFLTDGPEPDHTGPAGGN